MIVHFIFFLNFQIVFVFFNIVYVLTNAGWFVQVYKAAEWFEGTKDQCTPVQLWNPDRGVQQ